MGQTVGVSDAFVVPAGAVSRLAPPDVRHPARLETFRPDSEISVEIAEADRLAALDDDWRDLLRRTDAPNVFMHPRLLRAAALGCRVLTLLAWRRCEQRRQLAGVWGFSLGQPRRSVLPMRVLRAPAPRHAYLATPVIDLEHLDATLQAMLDRIAEEPALPNTLTLEAMGRDGAGFASLVRVLEQRRARYCVLGSRQRPKLVPGFGSDFDKMLSGSSRKKLRQYRRRLVERSPLKTTVSRSADEVRRAFEAFLALEAQGWKGRKGTALSSDPDEARFAREMVAALAEAGDVSVHALELDGRAVSMQVVLHAGPAAFTWKTAYDEALSDFSPGMLLFEDCTRAFLADGAVASVDSCAYDDAGYMSAWPGRQAIVDLWLDVRRGGSASFCAVEGLQRAYFALRQIAKRAYLVSEPLQNQLRARLAPKP